MDSQIHYKVKKKLDNKIVELLEDSGLRTSDLDRKNSNIAFITASLNDPEDPLGVVALEPFGAVSILRSLAVRQDKQKRGFGKELVLRLEQYANRESIKTLFLLTETADKFFKHLDYKVISRKKAPEIIQDSYQFSHLCPSTAICMYKELNG